MDDTTKAIVDRITIRYPAPQQVPSGDVCSVFFDCIQLSPAELARLAAEATGDLQENIFHHVVGIAYTGILFASAVAGGKQVSILKEGTAEIVGPPLAGRTVLVIDDVVHQGRRLREARRAVEKAGGIVVGFACIVNRSGSTSLDGLPLYAAIETTMS